VVILDVKDKNGGINNEYHVGFAHVELSLLRKCLREALHPSFARGSSPRELQATDQDELRMGESVLEDP
jgi:hypothetical protein